MSSMKRQNCSKLLCVNDDFIFEKILPWLPPNSLLKFRSVSKSWYSAICHPDFIAKHQSHFGNDNCFLSLLVAEEQSLKLRHIPEQQNLVEDILLPQDFAKASSHRYRIRASCNGLFCYASVFEKKNNDRIYLCNPSIRWARAVVPFPLANEEDKHALHGVGFDRCTNDYKLIMLENSIRISSSRIKAAVYSVKAHSWKQINNVPEPPFHIYGASIFLHGFIHWNGHKRPAYKDRSIMLSDVGNEVFGEMKLPPAGDVDFDGLINWISISVVRGSLCHLRTERFDGNRVCCHMWMMKEYGVTESWTKQAVIEFELLDIKRPSEVVHVYTQATVGGKIICSIRKYNELSYYYENVLFDPQTVQYIKLGRTHTYGAVVSIVPSLELVDVIM